jgi:hypothetical protein
MLTALARGASVAPLSMTLRKVSYQYGNLYQNIKGSKIII